MREIIKYYPLDLDPEVRCHVVLDGNTIYFSNFLGQKFAVSSRRLRRMWHTNSFNIWWKADHSHIR